MNYGLYLSAGGALTSLYRQDVLANNLANLNTVGYKADEVAFRSRPPERVEAGALIDPNFLLEQLGGGQFIQPTRIKLEQGDLAESSNDLDLAIEGEGFFLVHNGKSGGDNIRFTRDGRFTLNAAGELVMTGNGLSVLDVNDKPIRLDRGAEVHVDRDGRIMQNGAEVARLQIATIADTNAVVKEGDNLMRAHTLSGNTKRQLGSGMVRQGYVESSAVDPILALNEMIDASKAVQANATMMQYHDNALGQAINTFGRVA